MSNEQNVLEELLARVQRNAALPRALPPAAAKAAFAAAPPAPASAPKAAFPVFEVPGSFVEPPLDSSPEFESEPMFEAPLPPAYDGAFDSDHPPVAAHVAPLDQSVDEMLLADPFPSMPPPPVAQQSLTDMLDEDEPIPLVSVSPHSIAKEDISAVMNRSDLSHDVPEELLEDDIVEMSPSEGEAVVPANHALDDLNFDDEDTDHNRELSEPPASSSRHRVASSMDEALARAAEQMEMQDGREVPLKTPPPESGPQAAMALPAGVHAPLAPDIEELLEADILPVGGVNAAVPTPEQLGQTIDLEEARGPRLELDSPHAAQPAPLQEELSNEELEVTLPQREFGGGYRENLMPPPEARQDLDAHRHRFGDAERDEAPPPESLAQYPSRPPPQSGFAPVIVPASVSTDSHADSVSTVTIDAQPNAEFAPELLMRPNLDPSPVAKFVRVQAPRPNTFLELLDASLGLGRN